MTTRTEQGGNDQHTHDVGIEWLEPGVLLESTPSCGPTQHRFWEGSASVADPADWVSVIFCRNCGETRKLEVPA